MRRNLDKASAAMRRWRGSHRAEDRAAKRRHYALNDEAVRAANAAYAKLHPEVAQIKRHRRRIRESAVAAHFTAREWRALVARHQGRCAYCGGSGPLTVDHRIPIARGGTNAIDNILPACARCNARKHVLTDVEFRARLAAESNGESP